MGVDKINITDEGVPAADLKKQFMQSNHADYLPKGDNETDISLIAQAFREEVKAYLFQANPSAPKEEILFVLQQIVLKYTAIENRVPIIEFILEATEKHYKGLLQEDDLLRIWF